MKYDQLKICCGVHFSDTYQLLLHGKQLQFLPLRVCIFVTKLFIIKDLAFETSLVLFGPIIFFLVALTLHLA